MKYDKGGPLSCSKDLHVTKPLNPWSPKTTLRSEVLIWVLPNALEPGRGAHLERDLRGTARSAAVQQHHVLL